MGIFSGGSGSGSAVGATIFDSTLTGSALTIDTTGTTIPGTYRVLRAYMELRSDAAGALPTAIVRVNNDSGANYDWQAYILINGTESLGPGAAQTNWNCYAVGAGGDANAVATWLLELHAYADTTFHKAGIMTGGVATATAASTVYRAQTVRWRNTAAISRISVAMSGGGNLLAGSRLTVRGI